MRRARPPPCRRPAAHQRRRCAPPGRRKDDRMFLTRKHLSRRTMLKGAGATLALPLLDAMVPAATALAQTAARSTPRFVGCFVPHGMAPGYWVPAKEGTLEGELPFNFKP